MPGVMGAGGDGLAGPGWGTGTGLDAGVHHTDHVTEHKSAVVQQGLGLGAQTFTGSLRLRVECDSECLKLLSETKSGSHKSL